MGVRQIRWTWVTAVAALALAMGPFAFAQEERALLREYFVRQNADQPLIIRVNPFEAEFRVRVSGPDGRVLQVAGLPGNRTLPVLVFVEGEQSERQLDIRIEGPWHTDHTRFELEFSRLDVRDDLSASLADAYRLLSLGQQWLEADSAADWSVRAGLLLRAANMFEGFGMEELRLWAGLSAVHLMLHELGDPNGAFDLNLGLLQSARAAGLAEAGLSALLLQAEILSAAVSQALDPERAAREAEQALVLAAEQAAALGYGYEQARAYFLLGRAHADREDFETALGWYDRALEISVARQATALATGIRERMVQAYEQLGDMTATEQVLGSIVSQLASEGAEAELVRGLLSQAALYLEQARYEEAIEVLLRARAASDVSLTRLQVALMLGQAHYETGRFEEAEAELRMALVNPDTGLFRRPSPLLPLGQGLDTLASILRHRGDTSEAGRVRQVQSRHLVGAADRARWSYERILDALAAGEMNAARALFGEAESLLRRSGPPGMTELARLAVCAGSRRQAQTDCGAGGARKLYAQSSESGGPRTALAARWLLSLHLAQNGRTVEAVEELTELLAELHFYRSELPGVLGSWYWVHRAEIFAAGLEWAANLPAGEAQASLSLLAMARAVDQASGAVAEAADELRVLIAAGGRHTHPQLAAARERFARQHPPLSTAALDRIRGALGPDEALLAIDLADKSAQAWIMRPAGVQRRALPAGPGLLEMLAGVRGDALQVAGGPRAEAALRELGEGLFGPLVADLPPRVYRLSMGQLAGVALEAARLDGRYLAESRQLAVRAGQVAEQRNPAPAGFSWPEQAFVAGHPLDWTGAYPEGLQTTAEIRAVAEHFVGPGLHIVQGNALLPDEFDDERLARAGIVHLAMPAVIDLADPRASWLELSEPGRGQGRARLTPADLRRWDLTGAVVFLSQSTMRGAPADRFASRIGLVSDLLESGAVAVIAARWPPGPEFAGRFAGAFYGELRRSGDIVEAFAATQRALLGEAAAGSLSWAAYQLYLR